MTANKPSPAIRNSLRVALLVAGLLLATPPAHAANPPATWTTGHKKVLVIPIRFTDQAGPSDTPSSTGYLSGWGNMTNGVTATALNDFFQRASYGKVSMEFTVLPEIDMGVSYTTYNSIYGSSGYSKFTAWDQPGSLADDARAKARLAGIAIGQAAHYDTDNYDLDVIAIGFVPGQGTLSSGRSFGKGVFGTTFKALAHEFCHNFGLQHGNGISRSTFYSPLRINTFFTDTYGDPFDLMGWKNTAPIPLPADRDPNPFWKNLIGWLPDANITTTSTSDTYRIYAFDQPTLDEDKRYALRIVRDPARTYWFSYRQSITNTESIWSANGLEVRIGGELIPATAGHTTLLDMTPGSRGLPNSPGATNNPYATMYDAPLAIGRTYSDAEANLHVTPIKKAGTSPESLDVVVNFGPFPGNIAPTASISPPSVTVAAGVAQALTTTASDANGDTLSYYWEFDDPDSPGGTAAGNTNPDARLATQGSHTWTRTGTFLARCTVTDMKGGKTIASASVTVTGGTTALRTITGIVKDENGNPLQGAVVNNYKATSPNLVRYGATNFVGSSETAADGKFVVHVPATLTGTFYLNVLYQGFSFTCSFSGGAVSVSSASVANVNFTRVRSNRSVSGGIYVAGRGYDPTNDGALTITANGQNIAAGLGSWSTTVPDGTPFNVTATPANGTYTVTSFFPNPYVAVDDFNLLHLFVNIPGRMPQVAFTSPGASSADNVGTVNIPVTLTLPAGSNSWPMTQWIYYSIDPSSTAEYDVDYIATGGDLTFYGGQVPTPQNISLKILPTGQPKNKTVVFRLQPATSIANLGAQTTFTYTITNPAAPVLQVTSQPDSVTTSVTSNASFSVTASGNGTLTYQWRKDTAPIGGATGSTYSLLNLQTNDAGNYTVVVSDTSGSVTSLVATLVVNRLSQSISFGALPAKVVGDAAFSLTATASSGLPVSFASSDPSVATVSGNTVTIVGPGTANITASQPGNATFLAASSATQPLTVAALPPPTGTIQFVSDTYSVIESAGTVTLVATRTGGSAGAVSGYYKTSDGTATAGLDYTPTTNFVSWADGDAAITNLNDSLVEPSETFTVTFIAASSGATLGSPTNATVTITDDDVPPPSHGSIQFASDAYSVIESAGTVTLVATRTGGSAGAVSGYYKTSDGTATAGLDYTPTTNFVSWADGDAAPKNISITILNDSLVEPSETFTVTFIAASSGATLGSPTNATVTITDDDVPPPSHGSIQFASDAYSVIESAGTVTLVATRTGGSAGAVSGYYKTSDGTATAGLDYTPTTNAVLWADGDSAPKNISIPILANTAVQSNISFVVTLFAAGSGAALGTPTNATVTILNDPTIAPPPPPAPNRRPLAFSQSLSAPINVALPVTLAGLDGDGDPLTFAITVAPTQGTLSGTPPNLTYTATNAAAEFDYLMFIVNDGKTNSRPAYVAFTVVTDTATRPIVELVSPATNSWFVGPTNLTLAATAADPSGIVAVQFMEGTNFLGTVTSPPYEITWTNAQPGSYTLVAKAYSNVRKVSYSKPVNIRILPAPPLLSFRPIDIGTHELTLPSTIDGTHLEESTDLIHWTLMTNILTDTGTDRRLTLPRTNGHFYRFSIW
jgi:hypothetical protein